MTIIKPQNTKSYAGFLAIFFFIALVGCVVYIFQYNEVVSLRQELRDLKVALVESQTDNAELKNNLYTITDAISLEQLAYQYNLILEEKPSYLRY